MARRIVAAPVATDNWPMAVRTIRRAVLAMMVAAVVLIAACSPLPNPNPSSPANQLPGVGSPNQLNPGGSAAP
jgi:hypothetical protein